MKELEAKIQRLRVEYMDALRDYLRSSIFKETRLKKADSILEELKRLTNNPNLIGLNVVMGDIPVKEVKA